MASPKPPAEQKKQALYEFTKDKNLYEYGKDIIYNTEKMSLNRNILNKKYYMVIPYYSEELGQNDFEKMKLERWLSRNYTQEHRL